VSSGGRDWRAKGATLERGVDPMRRASVVRDLREVWAVTAQVTGNFVLVGLLVYALAALVWP
jgi:hypothetical protein